MKIDLTDKIVLVTGGGAGIGQGCAENLAEAGGHVIINDIDAKAGKYLVDSLRKRGLSAEFFEADISDYEAVKNMANSIHRKHGRLNVLINNAGFNLFKNLSDTEPEEWDAIMNVDLRGVYLVTRAMIPLLENGSDSTIVNIASVHAKLTIADIAAYAAAKGGVTALTRSLCQELGPRGIRVNSVSPGFVMTPLLERWLASEPDRQQTLNKINGYHPIGRIGTISDIGNIITFLSSDKSTFITGSDITIDGGLSSRLMH